MTVINLGPESETSILVNATCQSCLDIVQVKLSALNAKGIFLKVPVANIANMFNACL